jgi:hypothetical protein|nr:MAG TPA: hypothetical protein [Caudoviricetes sp.]
MYSARRRRKREKIMTVEEELTSTKECKQYEEEFAREAE